MKRILIVSALLVLAPAMAEDKPQCSSLSNSKYKCVINPDKGGKFIVTAEAGMKSECGDNCASGSLRIMQDETVCKGADTGKQPWHNGDNSFKATCISNLVANKTYEFTAEASNSGAKMTGLKLDVKRQ
jgi:hypothetical protein